MNIFIRDIDIELNLFYIFNDAFFICHAPVHKSDWLINS